MDLRKPMTPTEKKLFSESVIREYKLKTAHLQKKPPLFETYANRLKVIAPLNITVGIIVGLILIYMRGWEQVLYLLLSGVFWMTVISSVVAVFLKVK